VDQTGVEPDFSGSFPELWSAERPRFSRGGSSRSRSVGGGTRPVRLRYRHRRQGVQ